jgi:hypothetical protein
MIYSIIFEELSTDHYGIFVLIYRLTESVRDTGERKQSEKERREKRD